MGTEMNIRTFIENLGTEELKQYEKNVLLKNTFFDVLDTSNGRPTGQKADATLRNFVSCGVPIELIDTPTNLYIACISLIKCINDKKAPA